MTESYRDIARDLMLGRSHKENTLVENAML